MDRTPHLHMHHYKLSHLRHVFQRLMVLHARHDVDYRAIYDDEDSLALNATIDTIKRLWATDEIDKAHRWVVGNIYNSDKGYYSVGRPVGRNTARSNHYAEHKHRTANGHSIMVGLDDDFLSDMQLVD